MNRFINGNIDVYIVRDYMNHKFDFPKVITSDIYPNIMEFIKSNATYLLNDSNLPRLNEIVIEEILKTPNISVSSKLYLSNQIRKFYKMLLRENENRKREIDIWYNKMKDLIRQLIINKDSIFIYS